MSSNFDLLDHSVKKWVFMNGWKSLKDIQESSIPPILAGDVDVLISASTASGKTESFFLPACSAAVQSQVDGVSILYISPLKALINDQNRRLQSLCEVTGLSLTAWHGDSLSSGKNRLKKSPSGILLITPESLEAMLVFNPGWVIRAFSALKHIVIDEYHVFLGTERGQQLMSILNRIEFMTGRLKNPIPRIALSATLGNLDSIPGILRPNKTMSCTIIRGSASSNIRLQVRGYLDPKLSGENDNRLTAEARICKDLYRICRGKSNLVFANSRGKTESIAAQLRDLCEMNHVSNEFFPHHGSLSKENREYLESRLQKEQLPTTGVCTSTLELGIDIGPVESTGQIGAPSSVSGLRQRAGRSGRRDGMSNLRLFIPERELNDKSNIVDSIRMSLVQSLATVRLLVDNQWFEPPQSNRYHFSTLLQQILAVVAQSGSITATQLYGILCKNGPFNNICIEDYKSLLSHMSKKELIRQLPNGDIILDLLGEKIVGNHSFYVVFNTPEEYRVIHDGKPLGTLPVEIPMVPGQYILLGGRRWLINSVDPQKKLIMVAKAKAGSAPLFIGEPLQVHTKIRQEMLSIYKNGDYAVLSDGERINFANQEAEELFKEGLTYFQQNDLANNSIIESGKSCFIFTWSGDKIANTITTLLINSKLYAGDYHGVIEVPDCTKKELEDCLLRINNSRMPSPVELTEYVIEKCTEKYDCYLPGDLLAKSYSAKMFDVDGAKEWISSYLSNSNIVGN